MVKNLVVPELYAGDEEIAQFRAELHDMVSINLTPRQLCDLELLMNGGFFPLSGFLEQEDYESVLDNMRLANGELWPIPIVLDVSKDIGDTIKLGSRVALRDNDGTALAVLCVSNMWRPDKLREARCVFATTDKAHPGVHYLFSKVQEIYIGGRIIGLSAPAHYDFRGHRQSPNKLRALFNKSNWERVIAFQTRNPIHRAHHSLVLLAREKVDAQLLLHPAVGQTKPGDIDYFTRVRCYQAVLPNFPPNTTMLSLLNLAMRMAGPREALWHGLIRKNHGCSHFIIGRDHAGPGKNADGKLFYPPYAAQEFFKTYQDEIGLEMIDFKAMGYSVKKGKYVVLNTQEALDKTADKKNTDIKEISGTELRKILNDGQEIPKWFSFPAVINELRKRYPSRDKQGFTVFFTGLSGAGKSTIARALCAKLMELGDRPVTLLDGDIVRKNLSPDLGFSHRDREINIRRIGYVASEITKNGGIAVCALIAPYAKTRAEICKQISQKGIFVEIYVSTALHICERRDRKGLYAKARSGLLNDFTGISAPYEAPENPDLSIDTEKSDIDNSAETVLAKLRQIGLLHNDVKLQS